MANPGYSFLLLAMVSLTTGTAFIMWLGEQITERGIGNGMSLIIFTGIVVGLPRAVKEIIDKMQTGDWPVLQVIAILIVMVAVVALSILVGAANLSQIQCRKTRHRAEDASGQQSHQHL